jgi:hypothetical protein
MSTHANGHLKPPGDATSPGELANDPIRRALQYRWLSTDSQLVEPGSTEACGSRHDVDLVVIQVKQGSWAGDLDSYGRAPPWLRRLQARGQRRRR